MEQQLSLFDYAQLDSETRIVVQQYTSEIKTLMRRTAQDIIDIGQKLIEVKARLGHGNFGAWLAAEFEWSYPLAAKFMNVAERFNSINFIDLNVAPSALYLLAAPSTPQTAVVEAITRAESGETITHQTAKQIVQDYKPVQADQPHPIDLFPPQSDLVEIKFIPQQPTHTPIHVYMPPSAPQQSSSIIAVNVPKDEELFQDEAVEETYDGDEWYTPADFIEAARVALGEIDLDPASCDIAQDVVKADTYFTKDDNGLEQDWFGRVWCNPPYSFPLIKKFTEYAHQQFSNGNCEAVILLVNNCTDAEWFQNLARRYPVMFTDGRAKFWQTNQRSFATRQGQAIFYLGKKKERFFAAFSHLAYAPNMGD